MLFFSDKGKVYSEKVYQIPDADRAAKGIPLVNVLSLDAGEFITAAVSVPNFETVEYITLATRMGKIKRMALSELAAVRPSGIIAIGLENGDELGWARLTHGDNEIIFVTEQGQALRFAETEIRSMGRTAGGVTGIRLGSKDRVTSMEVIEKGGDLLLVTTLGYGKRTSLTEYPVKGRATGGVQTIARDAADKIGIIVSARVVQDADDLTIITANGMVLRTKVKDVRQAGRATRGVHMMDIKEGDRVASIARIAAAELKKVGVTPNDDNGTSAGKQFELPIK
jgi:DNA gyrase subunit A